MIERKYDQRQLGEGFIRDSIDDCWEPCMKIVDEILDDEEWVLVQIAEGILRQWRHGASQTRAESSLRRPLVRR